MFTDDDVGALVRQLETAEAEVVRIKTALAKRLGVEAGPSPAAAASKPKVKAITTTSKSKAPSGLTAEVREAFSDGKVHISKDLQKRFKTKPVPMKKALKRLVDQDVIKRSGTKGSGAYVLKGTPSSKR